MDSRPTLRRADSVRRPGRRQFLAALGAVPVVGLAGCTGGSDDGGGGGDSGSSDGESSTDDESNGGSASALACTDLTAEYSTYSGGDGALFADFEIPTVLADAAEIMPGDSQVWVRAVRPLAADGDAQFHLSIMQDTDGRETARGLLSVEEAVTEIEFNGETLTASKMSGTDVSGVEQLRVSLPYDDGGGTRYYLYTVQLEVENASGGEVIEACDAAIDEAARHVIESLQPNPDTSFGGSAGG